MFIAIMYFCIVKRGETSQGQGHKIKGQGQIYNKIE